MGRTRGLPWWIVACVGAAVAPGAFAADAVRVDSVKLKVAVDRSGSCKLALSATINTTGPGKVWYRFEGPEGTEFDFGPEDTTTMDSSAFAGIGRGASFTRDIQGAFRMQAAVVLADGRHGTPVFSAAVPAAYTCDGGKSVARPIGGAVPGTASTPPAAPGKVTSVRLRFVPDVYAGPCPGKIQLVGEITTDGPGTVWYHFLAGAVSHSPEGTVTFSGAGTKTVTVDGAFNSAPRVPNASLLAAMQDENGRHGPRNVSSGPVPYQLSCGGAAPPAPAMRPPLPTGTPVAALPEGTKVEASYADGTAIPLKVPEQVAFLFVHNIRSLEKDPCMAVFQRLCSLDEMLQGVKNRRGSIVALKRDPRREADYSYRLSFSGEPYQTAARYQVEAIPQRPGLGGFFYVSDRRGFSDFYFNPAGAATSKDKKLGAYGTEGVGFIGALNAH